MERVIKQQLGTKGHPIGIGNYEYSILTSIFYKAEFLYDLADTREDKQEVKIKAISLIKSIWPDMREGAYIVVSYKWHNYDTVKWMGSLEKMKDPSWLMFRPNNQE